MLEIIGTIGIMYICVCVCVFRKSDLFYLVTIQMAYVIICSQSLQVIQEMLDVSTFQSKQISLHKCH